MGNLISVGVHCSRGDEIILGNKSHIFMYEGGGASGKDTFLISSLHFKFSFFSLVYMGVGFHTLPNQADGTLLLKDIQGAVRADDPHYPRYSI
jgi:threonine aldolase